MTHIERRYETYKQDQHNLTVYRVAGGYRVNNFRTNKDYYISKPDGVVTCTCRDYKNRRKPCKHIIAVKEAHEESRKQTEKMTELNSFADSLMKKAQEIKRKQDIQKVIARW